MKKEEIASTKEKMLQYTGTKTIMATPMTRGEYNALRGWQIPEDENPNDEGYLVQYPQQGKSNVEGFDGYISWSPQKQFVDAYRASGTPKLRMLIEMLDLGTKVSKLDKYIKSIDPSHYQYELLKEQHNLMVGYYNILSKRYEGMKE